MIYWKLFKKFKFDHTDKWYIHKPDFVQENEMREILWNFGIQIVSPNSKRPALVLINKKKILCDPMDFAIPVNQRVKMIERENKVKY